MNEKLNTINIDYEVFIEKLSYKLPEYKQRLLDKEIRLDIKKILNNFLINKDYPYNFLEIEKYDLNKDNYINEEEIDWLLESIIFLIKLYLEIWDFQKFNDFISKNKNYFFNLLIYFKKQEFLEKIIKTALNLNEKNIIDYSSKKFNINSLESIQETLSLVIINFWNTFDEIIKIIPNILYYIFLYYLWLKIDTDIKYSNDETKKYLILYKKYIENFYLNFDINLKELFINLINFLKSWTQWEVAFILTSIISVLIWKKVWSNLYVLKNKNKDFIESSIKAKDDKMILAFLNSNKSIKDKINILKLSSLDEDYLKIFIEKNYKKLNIENKYILFSSINNIEILKLFEKDLDNLFKFYKEINFWYPFLKNYIKIKSLTKEEELTILNKTFYWIITWEEDILIFTIIKNFNYPFIEKYIKILNDKNFINDNNFKNYIKNYKNHIDNDKFFEKILIPLIYLRPNKIKEYMNLIILYNLIYNKTTDYILKIIDVIEKKQKKEDIINFYLKLKWKNEKDLKNFLRQIKKDEDLQDFEKKMKLYSYFIDLIPDYIKESLDDYLKNKYWFQINNTKSLISTINIINSYNKIITKKNLAMLFLFHPLIFYQNKIIKDTKKIFEYVTKNKDTLELLNTDKNIKWIEKIKKTWIDIKFFYEWDEKNFNYNYNWTIKNIIFKRCIKPDEKIFMWDIIKWSCLNTFWWSFSRANVVNAMDINKQVIYIYMDNKLIWRALIWINDQGELVIFPIYTIWVNINIKNDLYEMLIEYLKELWKKYNFKLTKNYSKVSNINYWVSHLDNNLKVY